MNALGLFVTDSWKASEVYNQSANNFEPRIGFAFSPFENNKTLIRGAYAIMTDQPGFGLVTGLFRIEGAFCAMFLYFEVDLVVSVSA